MTTEPALEQLNLLVGSWITDTTHPGWPGVVAHGTAAIEWLEGERFLIQRARNDHPDFPDSISIIGDTGTDRIEESPKSGPAVGAESRLCMHYFDSRGVFRVYDTSIDRAAWSLWRDAPGFSQRFTGTFADGGDTINGRWELSQDNVTWDDDLQMTYRRRR